MSSQLPDAATAVLSLWLLSSLGLGHPVAQNPLDTVSGLLLDDAIEEAAAVLEDLPETSDVLAFKGEIEFRRANFEEARAYYTQALDLDPNTARGHFGVGKLSMGKMRLTEAIDSLSEAAALDPYVPIYRLALADAWAYEGNVAEQARQLEAYVALEPTYDPERLGQVQAVLEVINDFGPDQMGVYELPAESAEPMTISQGLNLVFANVMVGDRGPFEFIVDTGASQTLFTERLLEELGLTPITSTVIYGIGGEGRVESGIYRIDRLAFGDVDVRNLPVGTFSDPLLGELADGIFSIATFGRELVSINYPDSSIEFNVSNESDDIQSERLPGWVFSNLVFVSLRVNGDYEGLFLLDTGAVTSVLSHTAAAVLGVTEDTPGAEFSLGLTGIAGGSGLVLTVPGVTLATPESQASFPLMVAIDMDEISKTLGVEIGGILGYDFLKDYRVSIDLGNAEVTLSR